MVDNREKDSDKEEFLQLPFGECVRSAGYPATTHASIRTLRFLSLDSAPVDRGPGRRWRLNQRMASAFAAGATAGAVKSLSYFRTTDRADTDDCNPGVWDVRWRLHIYDVRDHHPRHVIWFTCTLHSRIHLTCLRFIFIILPEFSLSFPWVLT